MQHSFFGKFNLNTKKRQLKTKWKIAKKNSNIGTTHSLTHASKCVVLLFKFSISTHVADIWHHKQNENIKFSHLAMMSYHISPTRRQSQRIHTSTNGTGKLAYTQRKKTTTTTQANQSFALYSKNTNVAIYSAHTKETHHTYNAHKTGMKWFFSPVCCIQMSLLHKIDGVVQNFYCQSV